MFILIALSLVVSGPAFAEASRDCGMAGSGMVDHEKMACCTPSCAVPAASALLPVVALAIPDLPDMIAPAPRLTAALYSFSPSSTDPPPRSPIS